MTEHRWKCGIPGCNWITYFWKRNYKDINANMSPEDVFEIVKYCAKCNAPKPDQTKKNERAHVAEDGDEDNAESHD